MTELAALHRHEQACYEALLFSLDDEADLARRLEAWNAARPAFTEAFRSSDLAEQLTWQKRLASHLP